MKGTIRTWFQGRGYGFIATPGESSRIYVHVSDVLHRTELKSGDVVQFDLTETPRGLAARKVRLARLPAGGPDPSSDLDDSDYFSLEDINDQDTKNVDLNLIEEISSWKREAKSEDTERYFFHLREVDQITNGEKYFVIGRKGSGKTAICEHLRKLRQEDTFAEKLSFKQFPFNDLYGRDNAKFTFPNQYITIWKYLIYSTICRLILKNESIDSDLRRDLTDLFGDDISLSRRVSKWVDKEFGVSLFGLSVKVGKAPLTRPSENWIEYVDYLEDLLSTYAGNARYYVLFDELDEDYRDIMKAEQHEQYTALVTSLFKAVQDIRSLFGEGSRNRFYPVVFLRDDIYSLVHDSDKNKWGDFKVELNWDKEKLQKLIAFRISRALDPDAVETLPFKKAWKYVFGDEDVRYGTRKSKRISTFDYIARSTLMRPRDLVVYLQSCAEEAVSLERYEAIGPQIIRKVDKAFSNYLREELADELFAVLPEINRIFDTISQLRKWNFSLAELERAYGEQIDEGYIKERNVKFVLQILYMFDVIGNVISHDRFVFRYQNPDARLNFNERVVVHRGLFKSLQII